MDATQKSAMIAAGMTEEQIRLMVLVSSMPETAVARISKMAEAKAEQLIREAEKSAEKGLSLSVVEKHLTAMFAELKHISSRYSPAGTISVKWDEGKFDPKSVQLRKKNQTTGEVSD